MLRPRTRAHAEFHRCWAPGLPGRLHIAARPSPRAGTPAAAAVGSAVAERLATTLPAEPPGARKNGRTRVKRDPPSSSSSRCAPTPTRTPCWAGIAGGVSGRGRRAAPCAGEPPTRSEASGRCAHRPRRHRGANPGGHPSQIVVVPKGRRHLDAALRHARRRLARLRPGSRHSSTQSASRLARSHGVAARSTAARAAACA